MKKFSNISNQSIKEEPKKKEFSKEELELESIKFSIFRLMDSLLTIRSYGSVRTEQLMNSTKIVGKEMFIEALLNLMSDKSNKDQIKALESLKIDVKDWISIDKNIDKITNESFTPGQNLLHVNKIKNFLNTYGKSENFEDVLDKYVSRIKKGENAYWRAITAEQMIVNPTWKKFSKKQLSDISKKLFFRAKQLGYNR